MSSNGIREAEGRIGAKTLIPVGIVGALLVVVISIVAWLLQSLAAKADAATVNALIVAHSAQLAEHSLKIQHIDDDNTWIKATLYEMARHQGVQVAQPPTHQP